jgi:hypothetical protein
MDYIHDVYIPATERTYDYADLTQHPLLHIPGIYMHDFGVLTDESAKGSTS